MKKSTLIMILSLVLAVAIGIGSTMAYLQDTDEDVNVMTLGNVYIDQIELERGEGGILQEFTQGQPLYPAVYDDENAWQPVWPEEDPNTIHWAAADENGLIDGIPEGAWNGMWDAKKIANVVDKFVFVKNTGKSDAYVRTIFAFEADTTDFEEVNGVDLIHVNWNGNNRFDYSQEDGIQLSPRDIVYIDDVVIDNVTYSLVVVTYTEPVAPGEVIRPSLLQVGMSNLAGNEEVEQFGETYDILVVSQAVQTQGFADAASALEAAFGEVSVNSHPWMDLDGKTDEEGDQAPDDVKFPVLVSSADELVEALEDGKDVILTKNIKIDPASMSNAYGKTGINVKNGQTINGGGYTIDIKGAGGTWDSGINTTGGLIKDLTVTGSFRGIFINHNSTHSEPVILDNVTIEGTTYTISCDQGMNQTLTAKNSTFKGWTSFAATLGDATFIDCYFGEGSGYSYCRPYAPTAFVGCEFEAGYQLDARAAVTFENCTLDGEPLTADNLATLVTSNIANATVK